MITRVDLPLPAADASPVPSPCTGVCRIDDRSGWCDGCLRSLEEVVAWGSADDSTRHEIWRQIGLRRQRPPVPSEH